MPPTTGHGSRLRRLHTGRALDTLYVGCELPRKSLPLPAHIDTKHLFIHKGIQTASLQKTNRRCGPTSGQTKLGVTSDESWAKSTTEGS